MNLNLFRTAESTFVVSLLFSCSFFPFSSETWSDTIETPFMITLSRNNEITFVCVSLMDYNRIDSFLHLCHSMVLTQLNICFVQI